MGNFSIYEVKEKEFVIVKFLDYKMLGGKVFRVTNFQSANVRSEV